MARPARPTPKGPRDVLSAGNLLHQNPALYPIIASRRGTGTNSWKNDSTRFPHVQYRHYPRAEDPGTARRAAVDRLSTASSFRSRTIDELMVNDGQRVVTVHKATVVPYRPKAYPGRSEKHHHHQQRLGHVKARDDGPWLPATLPYVALKVLELMGCVSILVLSRVFHEDLSLDYVHTMFAAVALLAAGIGLLIVWVKGHPVPDDCAHTTMLLVYSLLIPMLLCGGILVLQVSDFNQSSAVVGALFFVSTFLFCVDMTVMLSSILMSECCCYCCCCCFIPHRFHRIYPNRHPSTPDYSYHHHHWSHHQIRHHHHQNPDPKDLRHSYLRNKNKYDKNWYPPYPRTVPKMNVWS